MHQQATSIDYLTLRLRNYKSPREAIKEVLHLDPDLFHREAGRYRYANAFCYNNISVYYGGTKSMGICVQMTGDGCQEYCLLQNDPGALLGILRRMKSDDAVTRLDIAKDDYDGILNLTMISKMDKQNIRTQLDGKTEISKSDGGHTIYYGARDSEYSIRIYDKAVQIHTEGEWIRVQQVLRKGTADSFVRYLLNQIKDDMTNEEQDAMFSEIASRLLLKHLAFVKPGKSNKSRAALCPWWEEFLGTDKPLRIPKPTKIPSLIKKEEWVRTTISQLLSALTMILGTDWLIQVLLRGLEANTKRSSKYAELAPLYRALGNEPAIEMGAEAGDALMNALSESVAKYFYTHIEGSENIA